MLQEKIYKIQGLTIANYTACMWLSKSPVNIYTFKHSCLAVLIRSLSVNLTLQVWKSGPLDFGQMNCGTVVNFGLLDHLTITMLNIRLPADSCAISPTAFLLIIET